MKTSDKFKFVFRDKLGRIVDYFTIQNPSNVDRYSKLLFPLIFMLANVFYWAYYMYFWEDVELFASQRSSVKQHTKVNDILNDVHPKLMVPQVTKITFQTFLLKEWLTQPLFKLCRSPSTMSFNRSIHPFIFIFYERHPYGSPRLQSVLRTDCPVAPGLHLTHTKEGSYYMYWVKCKRLV